MKHRPLNREFQLDEGHALIFSVMAFIPAVIIIYSVFDSPWISSAEMDKITANYILDFTSLKPEPAERLTYLIALFYFPTTLYCSYRWIDSRIKTQFAVQIADWTASVSILSLGLLSIFFYPVTKSTEARSY
jgi:hypothetical protein